jgi:hypothetical protein
MLLIVQALPGGSQRKAAQKMNELAHQPKKGAEITDELKPTSDRCNHGNSSTESTNELQEHGNGN